MTRLDAHLLVLLAGLLLAGCAQILGLAQPEPASGADAGGATADAASPDAGLLACSDELAPPTGETPVDTETAGDRVTLSCGNGAASDVTLQWMAPVTDYYVFDTFTSGFDTVLGLFDDCDGTELACNNNAGLSSQSELVFRATAGQRVLAVVDGFAGDSGQGRLDIQRVSCPDADLTDQLSPLSLSTAGFGDDLTTSCGGGGGFEDRAFHYRAPEDALYTFHATAVGFRPTLALRRGPRCSDPEFACSEAMTPPTGAVVARYLHAGEDVSLVVDGTDGQGPYTLEITRDIAASCPASTLVPGASAISDTTTDQLLAPSCGFAVTESRVGTPTRVQDRSYALTLAGVPTGCDSDCAVRVDGDAPFVAYVLAGGDCGGKELQCVIATDNGMGGFTATVNASALVEMDRTVTVVVSAQQAAPPLHFTIGSECPVSCV